MGANVSQIPDLGYGYPVGLPTSGTSDRIATLSSKEKKRRMAVLATLRKKLIRRRRPGRSADHARIMREFLSDWFPWEIAALNDQYEATAALKELAVQADAARPPAMKVKQSLAKLFDLQLCTDVELVYQGMSFPAHRSLLCVRCPYFREQLSKYPGYGAKIPIDVRLSGLDSNLFTALLRYLYTGDLSPTDKRIESLELLVQIGEEFGVPNALERDLRYLMETGDCSDAILVFTSDTEYQQSLAHHSTLTRKSVSGFSDYGFSPADRLELPCHKAVLSARSPFFRNLIQRRARSGEEQTERQLRMPTRIVLDENVIPRKYARVLLRALYQDVVDLSCVLRGDGQPSVSSHSSVVEEVIEVYQIGRFLELDILCQGCEDILTEHLSIDNLLFLLQWSEQPHGSAWVHRQATNFLREEFQSVWSSPVLLQLDKVHLIEALQSDYLQARELDVLQSVLKWGEHQLIRRMEEREPNVVSQTIHSVTKKGVKKRDLSDLELRDIVSEVLPYVRIDHVIPASSEVLQGAIRRGLVSIPPSHMLGGDECLAGRGLMVQAWIRTKHNGIFVKPRYFSPFAEEVKALMVELRHHRSASEFLHLRTCRMSPHIPDTLYMVDDRPSPLYDRPSSLLTSPSFQSSNLDVVAGAIPVPGSDTMALMLTRVRELRSSGSAQRALSLPHISRHDVSRQLHLRVSREFNLPDSVADVLQSASLHLSLPDSRSGSRVRSLSGSRVRSDSGPSSSCSTPGSTVYRRNFNPRNYRCRGRGDTRTYSQADTSPCLDGGHLSDVMPDIALATTSFSQLQLHDEIGLDLGDGPLYL